MIELKSIALFCNTLNPGGAETVMVTLANSFIENNLSVTFILGNKVGALLESLDEKIKVIDLGNERARNIIMKLPSIIRGLNPDVLLSTQTHMNLIAIASNIIASRQTKVIIREASTPSLAEKSKNKFYILSKKFIYKKADGFISVSKESKNDIAKYYDLPLNRIKNIYNPVFDSTIDIKKNQNLQHPWFKDGFKVIIGMGRLVPDKGFDTLIKSFAIAKKELTNIKLIILGGKRKKYEKTKEELSLLCSSLNVSDDIEFYGHTENPFKFLNNASLYVLSSRREGLPGGLIQALACGCPVVSTTCKSGPREILENGKYGSLVKVGDYTEMSKAIVKTISNPLPKDILIKRAEFFNVSQSVDGYLSYFKSLLGANVK